MAIYVVTGGAGFIGSNIVEQLLANGEQVRVVDDFSTGYRHNLEPFADDIHLYEGTVCDIDLLQAAFGGADYVLHQAALASVPRSIADPIASNQANVDGTLKVFKAAHACGVRRVVYASSSSVYGDAPTLPKREDMKPAPKSPYAVSKLTGEYYGQVFDEVYELETVALRYFNVFGPRQDPASQYAAVIPIFIRHLSEGRPPKVFGDGEQSRDFTFVDNVVQANLKAATARGAGGTIANVGCGERYTLNTLIGELQRIMDTDVEAAYEPPRPGDVRHSEADIACARQAFDYEPTVGFREGLRRTVEWYKREMM